MGSDRDLSVSLPAPPPPNPVARRAAIDSAMRRFDGIADKPSDKPQRPSLWRWASTHRGAAGGLVTAALIAVVSIPAIRIAIQDHPLEVATEDNQPGPARPGQETAASSNGLEESATSDRLVTANEPAPRTQSNDTAPAIGEVRSRFAAKGEEKAQPAAPAPEVFSQPPPAMMAAPPPPPPPPPPPVAAEPEAQAADVGSIVVTGSRVRRPNLESATPVSVVGREVANDPFGDFLSQLQGAFADNDRRAVLRLVGLPLRVRFAGDARTYRTRQDVERDYDRIFTSAVRQSVVNAGTFGSRDARLKSAGRLSFGCGNRTCSSSDTIRIREVNP